MKTTYRLVVQSEEKSRNILETAIYALFALSALTVIWQFADGPAMPAYHAGRATEKPVVAQIAS